MKSDFAMVQDELSHIGILRVSKDFYAEPKRRGSCYFVKSPSTPDRTASLALYPNSNRFVDFANGNKNGDCIAFVAYIRGCNQWEALKELQGFYGLTDSRKQDKQEARRRIQLQQQEEKKKAKRRQEFYTALYGEIDHLKHWGNIYKTFIKNQIYKPFTEGWCYCVNELQKIEYQLDILCAIDNKAYPCLKSYHENLPSNRFQWLLDVLEVLQKSEVFTATKNEIKEITAQRDFELTRKSGMKRRCNVEW